jgi:hypothetical protein
MVIISRLAQSRWQVRWRSLLDTIIWNWNYRGPSLPVRSMHCVEVGTQGPSDALWFAVGPYFSELQYDLIVFPVLTLPYTVSGGYCSIVHTILSLCFGCPSVIPSVSPVPGKPLTVSCLPVSEPCMSRKCASSSASVLEHILSWNPLCLHDVSSSASASVCRHLSGKWIGNKLNQVGLPTWVTLR